eukprot:SAG22_NODE_5501_length_1003_cov_1.317478_1_plen_162_part_10
MAAAVTPRSDGGGGDDPASLTPRTTFNQAAVAQHTGDFDAAEEFYADLAQHLAETLGPEHPETRKTQYHWAVLCEQVGDYEAAGHLYRLVDQAQEAAGLEPGPPAYSCSTACLPVHSFFSARSCCLPAFMVQPTRSGCGRRWGLSTSWTRRASTRRPRSSAG